MEKVNKQKRFTLSLPETVHEELSRIAASRNISARDVIIKSLKLGMIAFETEGDSSKELIIREHIDEDNSKETRIVLI